MSTDGSAQKVTSQLSDGIFIFPARMTDKEQLQNTMKYKIRRV
jgi:hypothetical protein